MTSAFTNISQSWRRASMAFGVVRVPVCGAMVRVAVEHCGITGGNMAQTSDYPRKALFIRQQTM